MAITATIIDKEIRGFDLLFRVSFDKNDGTEPVITSFSLQGNACTEDNVKRLVAEHIVQLEQTEKLNTTMSTLMNKTLNVDTEISTVKTSLGIVEIIGTK